MGTNLPWFYICLYGLGLKGSTEREFAGTKREGIWQVIWEIVPSRQKREQEFIWRGRRSPSGWGWWSWEMGHGRRGRESRKGKARKGFDGQLLLALWVDWKSAYEFQEEHDVIRVMSVVNNLHSRMLAGAEMRQQTSSQAKRSPGPKQCFAKRMWLGFSDVAEGDVTWLGDRMDSGTAGMWQNQGIQPAQQDGEEEAKREKGWGKRWKVQAWMYQMYLFKLFWGSFGPERY